MMHEKFLKLWIINQYAVGPDQPGGTRHAGLARGLSEHGIEPLIIASPRSYMSGATAVEDKEQDGSPEFLWLSAPAYSGNSMGRVINMMAFAVKVTVVPLWMVLRRRLARPDVIMGSSPSMFAALAAWVLAKATGAKFVLEIRDIYPKTIIALGHASASHPFVVMLSLMERFLYRRAELVVSPLQRTGEHIQRTIGQPKRWTWIPNFVDMSQISAPSPVQIHPPPFTVVYTGQHGVANSLDTVVEAARLLSDDGVEFKLYGDGVAKSQLQQKVINLGITNVIFEDPVPKNEVHKIQQASDAVLLMIRDSPLWEDGFSPNKLYDYLASGRPTIFASAAPYNPVQDANAGVTVPPENPGLLAEAILGLMLLSADERTAMGQRGQDLIRKVYDLNVVASVLNDELRSVCGLGS